MVQQHKQTDSIFDELVPSWVFPRRRSYILRNINLKTPGGEEDLSLSYCGATTEAFFPEFYKIAPITPGKPNACKKAPTFHLEGIIDYSLLPVSGKESDNTYAKISTEDVEGAESCKPAQATPLAMPSLTMDKAQKN